MNWNKKIYECYFALYDVNDNIPLYFDNILDFMKYYKKPYDYIKRLVYRFKKTNDNYILVNIDNQVYRLYAYED